MSQFFAMYEKRGLLCHTTSQKHLLLHLGLQEVHGKIRWGKKKILDFRRQHLSGMVSAKADRDIS